MPTSPPRLRSPLTSLGRVVGLLALAAFAGGAQAGSGVQLPAGEDPSDWSSALELAELEVGATGPGPRIRIEVLIGGRWLLRAEDERGTFRTAEVDRPDTPREREAVALIASGLIRAMAVAMAPPEPLVLPPPPPPPVRPVPAPRPAPAAAPVTPVGPPVAPAPAPEVAPEPEPPAAPVAEPAPAEPAPAEPAPAEPTAAEGTDAVVAADPAPVPPEELPPEDLALERGPVVDITRQARKERTGRRRVAMAPLQLETTADLRPRSAVAPGAGLGLRLAQQERWSFTSTLSLTANHAAYVDGTNASFSAVDLDVNGMYRVGRMLSVGPVAGLSYRTFRQGFFFVGRATLPVAGGGLRFTPVGGRWWAVQLSAQARVDLGVVQMIPAAEAPASLGFFAVRNGISLVFGDQVDPFRPKRTSGRR